MAKDKPSRGRRRKAAEMRSRPSGALEQTCVKKQRVWMQMEQGVKKTHSAAKEQSIRKEGVKGAEEELRLGDGRSE